MTTLNSPTVAVVDDHESLRKQLCTTLTLMGFQVIMDASNGIDFLKQLAHTKLPPDLCLLDINMPEMNGVQTALCIKSIWPQMKILAFTFDSKDVSLMLESGADACLFKGVSAFELKDVLLRLYGSNASVGLNNQ